VEKHRAGAFRASPGTQALGRGGATVGIPGVVLVDIDEMRKATGPNEDIGEV